MKKKDDIFLNAPAIRFNQPLDQFPVPDGCEWVAVDG